MKKRLTQDQEFEILKIVLNKFLWLGVIIMGFGMYVMVSDRANAVIDGIFVMLAGAVVLILFLILIVKEYE